MGGGHLQVKATVAAAVECIAQCYRLVWNYSPHDRVGLVLHLSAAARDQAGPARVPPADTADTVTADSSSAQEAVLAHAHDVQVGEPWMVMRCAPPNH